MTKNKETISMMKDTKRMLDDAFKSFNKAKTEEEKNCYLDVIRSLAMSIRNYAYDVKNEK